jgi:hypothetical protein
LIEHAQPKRARGLTKTTSTYDIGVQASSITEDPAQIDDDRLCSSVLSLAVSVPGDEAVVLVSATDRSPLASGCLRLLRPAFFRESSRACRIDSLRSQSAPCREQERINSATMQWRPMSRTRE